jgi:hypothetical protein
MRAEPYKIGTKFTWFQSYHSKQMKSKKKSKFFVATIFCFQKLVLIVLSIFSLGCRRCGEQDMR